LALPDNDFRRTAAGAVVRARDAKSMGRIAYV
jgi:hypothetical protein